MKARGKILGVVLACAFASILPGCTAEQQGETAAEQDETVNDQNKLTIEGENPDAEQGLSTLNAPPGCVDRFLFSDGQHLRLRNDCSDTQWVKVVLRFSADTGCFSLNPHESKVVSWAWPGIFDRLDSC